MGASRLGGLIGEGVLQVRRSHDGSGMGAIGTCGPIQEDARTTAILERLVAQACRTPFEGPLDDPAQGGSKRYTGDVQVLRASRCR